MYKLVRNCWIFKCTFLIDTITGGLFRQPQLQHFLPNDLVLHQMGLVKFGAADARLRCSGKCMIL